MVRCRAGRVASALQARLAARCGAPQQWQWQAGAGGRMRWSLHRGQSQCWQVLLDVKPNCQALVSLGAHARLSPVVAPAPRCRTRAHAASTVPSAQVGYSRALSPPHLPVGAAPCQACKAAACVRQGCIAHCRRMHARPPPRRPLAAPWSTWAPALLLLEGASAPAPTPGRGSHRASIPCSPAACVPPRPRPAGAPWRQSRRHRRPESTNMQWAHRSIPQVMRRCCKRFTAQFRRPCSRMLSSPQSAAQQPNPNTPPTFSSTARSEGRAPNAKGLPPAAPAAPAAHPHSASTKRR